MSDFWHRNGVIWRKPGSGSIGPTEAIPQAFDRGYTLHMFDPKQGEWQAERALVEKHGGSSVPWTRVQSKADLGALETARIRWHVNAIAANVEIGEGENGSTRDRYLMAAVLQAFSHAGRGLLITDGWADPIGCWQGYRRWAGSVECFPEQYRPLADVNGCVLHASSMFRTVVPMLGAYGTTWLGHKPTLSNYLRPADEPRYVYCGDDVDDWGAW